MESIRHDHFCFCVWFDLMLVSVSWLFVFQVSEPDKDFVLFLHLCPFYLFLLYLFGFVMFQRWTNNSGLSFFVFFYWFCFYLLGFACGVRGVKGGKYHFILCLCGFYPFLFLSLWFWLWCSWCSRCQRRTNIALHKILLTAILSVSTVRIFARAKMFWADIRTLNTMFPFDFFGKFAPVKMFWADICT